VLSSVKWKVDRRAVCGGGSYEMEADVHLESDAESDACSSDSTVLRSLYSVCVLHILNTRHFRFLYSLYKYFRNSRVAVQFLLYLHNSSGPYT
jgi:hypothetical protein